MAIIIRRRTNSATITRRQQVRVNNAAGERVGFNYVTTFLGSIPLTATELPPDFAQGDAGAAPLSDAELATLERELFCPAREARAARDREMEEARTDPLRRLAQARELIAEAVALSMARPVPIDQATLLEEGLRQLVTQRARDWLKEVSLSMLRARTHFQGNLPMREDGVPFNDNPISNGWTSVGAEHSALRECLQERRWVLRRVVAASSVGPEPKSL